MNIVNAKYGKLKQREFMNLKVILSMIEGKHVPEESVTKCYEYPEFNSNFVNYWRCDKMLWICLKNKVKRKSLSVNCLMSNCWASTDAGCEKTFSHNPCFYSFLRFYWYEYPRTTKEYNIHNELETREFWWGYLFWILLIRLFFYFISQFIVFVSKISSENASL